MKMPLWKRVKHLLIAIDQLLWVIVTLGAGYPDETISSAMYRYEKRGDRIGLIMRPIIDIIFFWDKQHCRKSYLAERFRLQAPPHERVY